MAIIDADIEGVSFYDLCSELSQLAPTLPKKLFLILMIMKI